MSELEQLRAALHRIAALDPETDSDEGYNEWGEADCFRMSQKIALAALGFQYFAFDKAGKQVGEPLSHAEAAQKWFGSASVRVLIGRMVDGKFEVYAPE